MGCELMRQMMHGLTLAVFAFAVATGAPAQDLTGGGAAGAGTSGATQRPGSCSAVAHPSAATPKQKSGPVPPAPRSLMRATRRGQPYTGLESGRQRQVNLAAQQIVTAVRVRCAGASNQITDDRRILVENIGDSGAQFEVRVKLPNDVKVKVAERRYPRIKRIKRPARQRRLRRVSVEPGSAD